MSFVDERSKLPGETYRDYIVLLVAIVGGIIPETGSREKVAFISVLIPALLGAFVAIYYKFIPLSWKLFVAVVLSCGSYFMRWVITLFAVHFSLSDNSPALQWPLWRILFFVSLLAPCAYVIPLHYVILFFERRRLERNMKAR